MAVQVRRTGVAARTERRRGVLLPVAAVGVALLVPLVVLLSSVLLLGWQLQVIETASMEPHLPARSLAVVDPIDAADVRAGMTIVFEDPGRRGRLVAHRAVKRLPGELPVWQTQGDANAEPDPYPVHAAAVRGRVRWAIPRLGRVVAALHRPLTVVVLVGVPLALLAVTELRALRRRTYPPSAGGSRVFAVRELAAGGEQPAGALVEVFARREDAERLVDVRVRTEPARADTLHIVEHQLISPEARE